MKIKRLCEGEDKSENNSPQLHDYSPRQWLPELLNTVEYCYFIIQICDPMDIGLFWAKFDKTNTLQVQWLQKGIENKANNLQFVNMIYARIYDTVNAKIEIGYKKTVANVHKEGTKIVRNDDDQLYTVKVIIRNNEKFKTAFPVDDLEYETWAKITSKDMMLGRKVVFIMARDNVMDLKDIKSCKQEYIQIMTQSKEEEDRRIPNRLWEWRTQNECSMAPENQHQNPLEIVATQIAGLETPKDLKRHTEVVGTEGNMKVQIPTLSWASIFDARLMGSNYSKNTRKIPQRSQKYSIYKGRAEKTDGCNSETDKFFVEPFKPWEGTGDQDRNTPCKQANDKRKYFREGKGRSAENEFDDRNGEKCIKDSEYASTESSVRKERI